MRHFNATALVLALALTACLAMADDKPNPTGTWTWSPSFAGEERRLDMILNLKLEGDKLTGDLNWGRIKTPIEEGTYKDGELSFKVSSERTGKKVTILYTGKITGNTIKGKAEFVAGSHAPSRNWEARRADADGKVNLSKVAKSPEKKASKADEKPTEGQPKPEDFLGKWVGKWDEKFQVRFTITQDPKTKQLSAFYEFEQWLGKPLREERLPAKLEGNTLRIGRGIDLTISPTYPDKARALGRFVDRRLTADMVRERKLYPVPNQYSQRKALAAIKETLKSEYARAKTPTEKEALAKNLLKYGGETKDDPIDRFVLLLEARDQAADVAALDTALAAIDEMARWYKINPLEMKAEVLTKGATLLPAHAELLAGHALGLVDAAIADDQYEVADRMGALALTAAGKTTNPYLLQRGKECPTQIEENRKAYQSAKASLEILKARPDDPGANLTAGRFLCFAKQDWGKGLPFLAKGSDKKLAGLASQDAAKPKAATSQVKMADDWLNHAGSEKEPAKFKLLLRAHYWYLEALPNLTGLPKAKAIQRLDEIEKAIESSPLPKPKPEIHIVADIDGSDTLRISAHEAVWTHRDYQWPSSVEINGITWTPAEKPQNPKAATWPLLRRKVDFATATLTKLKGRGTVALKTAEDQIEISFDDPPFGSDTYEVVVSFGK